MSSINPIEPTQQPYNYPVNGQGSDTQKSQLEYLLLELLRFIQIEEEKGTITKEQGSKLENRVVSILTKLQLDEVSPQDPEFNQPLQSILSTVNNVLERNGSAPLPQFDGNSGPETTAQAALGIFERFMQEAKNAGVISSSEEISLFYQMNLIAKKLENGEFSPQQAVGQLQNVIDLLNSELPAGENTFPPPPNPSNWKTS